MAQGDRVTSNQDFFHQQSQNLLSHDDVQRLGSYPQLGPKSCQAPCQLQIFCFVHCRHLQRL
jgi:hypothetical protein